MEAGASIQLCHGFGKAASYGEAGEQNPGGAYGVASAVDVAEFRKANSQTQIGQKVSKYHPGSIKKVTKVNGDGDQRGGYDGGIQAGKQKSKQQTAATGQRQYDRPKRPQPTGWGREAGAHIATRVVWRQPLIASLQAIIEGVREEC